jgi:hypothetical protein
MIIGANHRGASVLTGQLRFIAIVSCLVVVLHVGCGREAGIGRVSGTVRVDGEVPAPGSSITFFPTDGNARSAGALLENGAYSVKVPEGEAKVEIRIPKTVVSDPGIVKQGPGADAGSGQIIESLPPKYNDQTELKMNVVSGSNQKDWDVSTK